SSIKGSVISGYVLQPTPSFCVGLASLSFGKEGRRGLEQFTGRASEGLMAISALQTASQLTVRSLRALAGLFGWGEVQNIFIR
ncbi:28727_t:CDS:2, partial [Racocetra persica]